ncbi:MAG TPA: Wzz/FepE/Etk N-terminal domain-containing protein, partial [Niabella sp.]|nr:Wzz/FepE/Etk N-terminal domain-containing protein [Niabella sp.]
MKVSKEGALDIWEEDEGKAIDFSKILRKVKAYWPLSVLCALLLGAAAMFYLYRTNPVYNVKASILIQDDEKKGGSSGNMLSSLQDLGLLSGASNVNNEQMVLTSYPLVEQVVKDQQLFLSFSAKEGFRQAPLHKSKLPFKAEVVDFNLSKLSKKQKEDLKYAMAWNNAGFTLKSEAGEVKGQWNTPLQMPFGRLVLQQNTLTANWPKGKTVLLNIKSIEAVTE